MDLSSRLDGTKIPSTRSARPMFLRLSPYNQSDGSILWERSTKIARAGCTVYDSVYGNASRENLATKNPNKTRRDIFDIIDREGIKGTMRILKPLRLNICASNQVSGFSVNDDTMK